MREESLEVRGRKVNPVDMLANIVDSDVCRLSEIEFKSIRYRD